MTTQISTTVDSSSLPLAATFLGIRGASRAGIVRAALALFHGHDRVTATRYAGNSKILDADSGRERVVASIPDELQVPEHPAWAIRVGLGMAAGLSRSQAEIWAQMEQGRPRTKATADAP